MAHDENTSSSTYSADDIEVMTMREAIRRRPGMYVGDVQDGSGLHNVLQHALGGALTWMTGQEHLSRSIVTLHDDMSATIEDYGAGLPVEPHPTTQERLATLLFTSAHPGALDYATLNALSESLCLEVRRDGHVWVQRFERGEPTGPLEAIKPTARTGTKLKFRLDREIFAGEQRLEFEQLRDRLHALAISTPGARLHLLDERTMQTAEFYYPQGVRDALAQQLDVLPEELFFTEIRHGDVLARVALAWRQEDAPAHVEGYANHKHTPDGGAHVRGLEEGLRRALASVIGAASDWNPEDMGGLRAMVSVHGEKLWLNQSGRELIQPELEARVADVLAPKMTAWLEARPALIEWLR